MMVFDNSGSSKIPHALFKLYLVLTGDASNVI